MIRCLSALALVALLAGAVTGQGAPANAPDAYKKLVAEYDAAMQKYMGEIRALAKTPEYRALIQKRDRQGMMKLRSTISNPLPGYIERFRTAAASPGNQADAAWFHAWLAVNSRDKKIQTASVETLKAGHLESPAMQVVAQGLFAVMRGIGMDDGLGLAGAIVDKNPDSMAKAHAHFARASVLRRKRGATDEERKQADADLRAVEELAPGTIIALKAAGPRFQRERLQIGMVAPDIEGKDLDGVAFKLSDYRGKVVVLDFWGDW
jgi:hypothetical protein